LGRGLISINISAENSISLWRILKDLDAEQKQGHGEEKCNGTFLRGGRGVVIK